MLSLTPRTFGMNLFDDMDNFFDNRNWRFFRDSTPDIMKTDIKEKDGLYLLTMDLPGFRKEDIKAELKDGYLTITAEKNSEDENKEDNEGWVVHERHSGSCSRTFYVGDNITENDIKAAFKDGTLNLSFPKEKAPAEPEKKYIAIE
ncbi:MAG: Hsp20/alpha crystallin family protein [Eubacteriales bacterium]|jgi:HSP20 family protein|nr:Hsp20/alpha crystallin family protein [Eubacteriales bacterium]